MSKTLNAVRGKSWSEITVRPKLNDGETLLSEDGPYDLLRCRLCKTVVKSGYVDVHLKKCEQHQANIAKDARECNNVSVKIVRTKYYYNIAATDHSSNPELAPTRDRAEPPQKKRKYNPTKTSGHEPSAPTLHAPPANPGKPSPSASLYKTLFSALPIITTTPATTTTTSTTTTSTTTTSKRKVKLRLKKRSHTSSSTATKRTSNSTAKEQLATPTRTHSQRSASTSTAQPSVTQFSAWDLEQQRMEEDMERHCSIFHGNASYSEQCLQFLSFLDECGDAFSSSPHDDHVQRLKLKMNEYMHQPYYMHLFGSFGKVSPMKDRTLDEYRAIDDIIGWRHTYALPDVFSNGVPAPPKRLRDWMHCQEFDKTLLHCGLKFVAQNYDWSSLKVVAPVVHQQYKQVQNLIKSKHQKRLILQQRAVKLQQQQQRQRLLQQQQQQQQRQMKVKINTKTNVVKATQRPYQGTNASSKPSTSRGHVQPPVPAAAAYNHTVYRPPPPNYSQPQRPQYPFPSPSGTRTTTVSPIAPNNRMHSSHAHRGNRSSHTTPTQQSTQSTPTHSQTAFLNRPGPYAPSFHPPAPHVPHHAPSPFLNHTALRHQSQAPQAQPQAASVANHCRMNNAPQQPPQPQLSYAHGAAPQPQAYYTHNSAVLQRAPRSARPETTPKAHEMFMPSIGS